MMISMVGGPYDGHRMWAQHIIDHTAMLVLKSSLGTRRFIYLPGPADWPAVLDGRMKVGQSGRLHYYELIGTAEGLTLRHEPCREAYWGAITRAIRGMPDRVGHPG